MFLVPASAKGISIGNSYRKMGNCESQTSEVVFDDVKIPIEHLLGQEGSAPELAVITLQKSRTLIAAACVGAAYRAMDLANGYLSDRVQKGKPLAEFPAIQHRISNMQTELHASWLMTLSAAASWDNQLYRYTDSSMAKMFASRTAARVVSECLELMGGYGYMCEYEIERIFRDIKLFEILEGPGLVQEVLIYKSLEKSSDNRLQSTKKAA
jgi:alkylation response protein AidB-like acyl-CoA dehydrogenase